MNIMVNNNNNEPTPEQREAMRQIAIANLNDNYICNIASAKLGSPNRYGTILSTLYGKTIVQAPEQNAYEQLFLPDLASDEGSLTKQRLMTKAAKIIQESLGTVKVQDIFALMNSERNLKGQYENKYVTELSEEETANLINGYLTNMVNKGAESALSREREVVIGGLEQMFCNEPALRA